jgi:hypothetical protein
MTDVQATLQQVLKQLIKIAVIIMRGACPLLKNH